MNIYHHLLISICLLLVINIDESKSSLFEILKKRIEEIIHGNNEGVMDDSSGKHGGRIYIFNKTRIVIPLGDMTDNSSEENEGIDTLECGEESPWGNSNEESGSKSSNEKSGSKSSNEESGSKSFNEESGSKSSHEESGNQNSNEASKIKKSDKKYPIKNSNEKNKIKKCNKKNEIDNSSKKNVIKNSNKENIIKNVHKENESKNSIKEVGTKPSNGWSYLSSIDTFHKAEPHEYPYHVAFIWNPDGRVLCQGAFIRTGWVVTSASCLSRYELHLGSVSVLVGATSLDDKSAISYELSEIFYYPTFNPEFGLNDFALVMLNHTILLNPEDQWKTLPVQYFPYKKRCQFTTFVGNTLYGKSVDYVFQDQCDKPKKDGQTLPYMCAAVGEKLIKLTLNSTLGSPLVCDRKVYGIKAKYTFFTTVDNLDEWIVKTITNLWPASVEMINMY